MKTRGEGEEGWTPPIVMTSLNDSGSIESLASEIDRHQAWLASRPDIAGRLESRRAQHVGSLVARRVGEVLEEMPAEVLRAPLATLYEMVVRRLAEPLTNTAQPR
jgi:LAO/AO transport system kinase